MARRRYSRKRRRTYRRTPRYSRSRRRYGRRRRSRRYSKLNRLRRGNKKIPYVPEIKHYRNDFTDIITTTQKSVITDPTADPVVTESQPNTYRDLYLNPIPLSTQANARVGNEILLLKLKMKFLFRLVGRTRDANPEVIDPILTDTTNLSNYKYVLCPKLPYFVRVMIYYFDSRYSFEVDPSEVGQFQAKPDTFLWSNMSNKGRHYQNQYQLAPYRIEDNIRVIHDETMRFGEFNTITMNIDKKLSVLATYLGTNVNAIRKQMKCFIMAGFPDEQPSPEPGGDDVQPQIAVEMVERIDYADS